MSKKIKCPKCGEGTTLENNEFKPFCSARCKTSDLGAWADGSYFIAGENAGTDLDREIKEDITYH